MYRIRVTDEKTGEWTEFLGQGATIEDAFKDGVSNAKSVFRPKQGGGNQIIQNVGVHASDGSVKLMPLTKWEETRDKAPAKGLAIEED